jgi:predicted transcriptional regulator of viral defense system
VELSRGLFRRADSPTPIYPDLLTVGRRAPHAVVCLTSALVVHELTDEVPYALHIAVPRSARPPRIDYPPTQVHRFEVATFEFGIQQVEAADDEYVRVYNAPRTIVDMFRMRNQMGETAALLALRRYVTTSHARVADLLDYALPLGVSGPLRAALDVLMAD